MVTVTLKLGISILNGGNILVQQVRLAARVEPSESLTDFGLHVENAGLPEGEERRGVFQKPVRADDVVQVRAIRAYNL